MPKSRTATDAVSQTERKTRRKPVKGSLAKRVSDLNPARWQEAPVELSSLWLFEGRERANGHKLDYHGNCVPQILTELLTRYTKTGEVMVDLFLGSGTSAIEAANLGRRCIGVELQPKLADTVRGKLAEQGKGNVTHVLASDSASPKTVPLVEKALAAWGQNQAQFLFLHPPYEDIIRFSEDPRCLSGQGSTEAFLDGFEAVARNAYALLEPGRFAGVVIGDKYAAGEWIPLGFYCMDRMQRAGFKLKSIVVKNVTGNERGKGKATNLWRYRALAGGFYLFGHEYVLVFEKP